MYKTIAVNAFITLCGLLVWEKVGSRSFKNIIG